MSSDRDAPDVSNTFKPDVSNTFKLGSKFEISLVIIPALFAAIWLAWTFSPGIMSFDSFSQYRQVLGTTPLTNAHPPITVYLWRGLIGLTGNVGSMLAFNQAFYWGTIALLAMYATPKTAYRLLILVVVGLCPPLAILSLHVWKDVGMFCGLGLASVALFAYLRGRHRGWLIVSLAAMFFAVAVRINGFIPALPLLLVCSYYWIKRSPRSWQRHVIIATVALSVLFTGGYIVIDKVLNRGVKQVYALGTLTVWDMVSISLAENKDLIPPYLNRAPHADFLDALRKANSREANYLAYAVVSPYPAPEYESQLTKYWLKLVAEHPLDYLRHRLHVLRVLLNINTDKVYYPFHPGIDENDLGMKFRNMTDEQFASYRMTFFNLSQTVIYRAWLYFALAIGALVLALVRLRRGRGRADMNVLAATIAFSGIVSDLSMLVIATAADYRYTSWTIFAALISIVILATTRAPSAAKIPS